MSNRPRFRTPPPIRRVARSTPGRAAYPRPVPYDDELLSWLAENGATPTTHRLLDEWQAAADAASVCLAIDAARLFGLITGGPTINVDRCHKVIEQAERRGVTPGPDAVDRWLPAFMAGDQ